MIHTWTKLSVARCFSSIDSNTILIWPCNYIQLTIETMESFILCRKNIFSRNLFLRNIYVNRQFNVNCGDISAIKYKDIIVDMIDKLFLKPTNRKPYNSEIWQHSFSIQHFICYIQMHRLMTNTYIRTHT